MSGIPPSPDRGPIRGGLLVGALVLGLAAFGLLLLTTADTAPGTGGGLEPYRDPAVGSEPERAAAYKAVRDYMDRDARGPGVVQVYCRDSRHRVDGRYWHFAGHVDLEYEDGRLVRHPYRAVVTRLADGTWKVLSLERDDPVAGDRGGEGEPG